MNRNCPLLDDNQWVLDQAAKDKLLVGTVGNLEPGTSDFQKQLDRFQRNPLFRGIRYGNLWNRDLSQQLSNPNVIADLRFFARTGLTLDTANPNPALLSALVRLTEQIPELRIVIDHLPQMAIPVEPALRKAYEADLQALSRRPHVYVKLSEVLRRVNGKIPSTVSFYRDHLDKLFGLFGEDRLLYGSDWPNSDQWLPFETGLQLVREYFIAKGQTVAEKYFWKNSVAAYHWVKRDHSQPDLSHRVSASPK